MELAIDQMVVLLCIVFLIIQVNIDREGFADDLGTLLKWCVFLNYFFWKVNECNEPFTVFLFNLVVKMSDGNRKHYPTKKVWSFCVFFYIFIRCCFYYGNPYLRLLEIMINYSRLKMQQESLKNYHQLQNLVFFCFYFQYLSFFNRIYPKI